MEKYLIELLSSTKKLLSGGTLTFVMSSTPNKDWGSEESIYPYSLTK
jgi:putative alpha-1,2-mannosidase